MIVELVPLNTVHIVWRHVEDYLKATLEKSAGEFNIDHVKAHVVAGLQSLYIALDKDTNKIAGAATVNFINYPNYRLAYGLPDAMPLLQILPLGFTNQKLGLRKFIILLKGYYNG